MQLPDKPAAIPLSTYLREMKTYVYKKKKNLSMNVYINIICNSQKIKPKCS